MKDVSEKIDSKGDDENLLEKRQVDDDEGPMNACSQSEGDEERSRLGTALHFRIDSDKTSSNGMRTCHAVVPGQLARRARPYTGPRSRQIGNIRQFTA